MVGSCRRGETLGKLGVSFKEVGMMRKPMLWVACCFGLGLAAGNVFGGDWAVLLGAAFLALTLACLIPRLRLPFVGLSLGALGWADLLVQTALLSPRDLRVLHGPQPGLVRILGVLVESPVKTLPKDSDLAPESERGHARLEVRLLSKDRAWMRAEGTVMVHGKGRFVTTSHSGELVELTGVLARPDQSALPELFDYRTYLGRLGVYYVLTLESDADFRSFGDAERAASKTGDGGRAWRDTFQEWARRTLSLGLPAEDESLRLQWAMALGWKPGLNNEVSEPFMRSGTMHIFAISGLHIALVAAILVNLLRAARCSQALCGAVAIPAIWLYTAATGWQASAVRSAVMMTLVAGGWILNRPGDLLNSLGAAAFLILTFDPQQLFMPGFQLSFTAVFFLAWTAAGIKRRTDHWFVRDPLLPEDCETTLHRALRIILQSLWSAFLTSLVAWLGSAALVAHYFHLLTPVSVLANLIVVPLSSLALTSAVASLFTGWWAPSLSVLINHSGWFWMECMVHSSRWFAELPMAFRYVPDPSWATTVVVLILLFAAGAEKPWRGKMLGWSLSVAGMLVATAVGVEILRRPALRLDILPLNGGEAILVTGTQAGGSLLIDCGNPAACERSVLPLLRARGLNRLDTLLLTHGDQRHVGGASWLLAQIPVRSVVTSDAKFRSKGYREILQLVDRTPELHRKVAKGDLVGPFRVLHPPASSTAPKADDMTLVLSLEHSHSRILLCSDLGKSGQNMLRRSEMVTPAAVVVSGMPTGGEPVGLELINLVEPRLILLTTATFPSSERPSSPLRARLDGSGAKVLYSDRDGGFQIEHTRRAIVVQSRSGARIVLPWE